MAELVRRRGPWPHEGDEHELSVHAKFELAQNKVLGSFEYWEQTDMTADIFWSKIREIILHG